MQAVWPELVERHGGGSERNTGGIGEGCMVHRRPFEQDD